MYRITDSVHKKNWIFTTTISLALPHFIPWELLRYVFITTYFGPNIYSLIGARDEILYLCTEVVLSMFHLNMSLLHPQIVAKN